MQDIPETYFEPGLWLVVFHRTTDRPWLDRLIPGPFKHVSVIGWVEPAKTWLFYDVGWSRTAIRAMPDKQGLQMVARIIAGNEVLQIASTSARPLALRLGFWCVPAVAHLIGIRGCGALPTQMYRRCLRAGANRVEARNDEARHPGAQGAHC